jgi:hypothetical protein
MDEASGGSCPLCGEAFDHHVAFRRHLSKVHDLQDEPGTRTTFRPSAMAPEPPPPATGGRRIGKKPNLDVLPDVWDTVDPWLARRLGRPLVEAAEVTDAPAAQATVPKKAARKAAKADAKQGKKDTAKATQAAKKAGGSSRKR